MVGWGYISQIKEDHEESEEPPPPMGHPRSHFCRGPTVGPFV